MKPTNAILVMHNKAQVRPKESAWLIIEKNGHAYKANFTAVPEKVTPLLSLQSNQQMGLVRLWTVIQSLLKVRQHPRSRMTG